MDLSLGTLLRLKKKVNHKVKFGLVRCQLRVTKADSWAQGVA